MIATNGFIGIIRLQANVPDAEPFAVDDATLDALFDAFAHRHNLANEQERSAPENRISDRRLTWRVAPAIHPPLCANVTQLIDDLQEEFGRIG